MRGTAPCSSWCRSLLRMSDDSGRTVGSVARALALLDALAEGPAGVNALARRLGVNPSSASRLLATLEQGGLVERDPGGPYRLGLHILALADRVLSRLDVREPARAQLRALAEPVVGRGDVLVAVLGLQGPAARFTAERRRAVLPALLTAAATLSRSL